MRKRIDAFTRILGDGRICNNAAERPLRGVALEEKQGCSPVQIEVAKAQRSCSR